VVTVQPPAHVPAVAGQASRQLVAAERRRLQHHRRRAVTQRGRGARAIEAREQREQLRLDGPVVLAGRGRAERRSAAFEGPCVDMGERAGEAGRGPVLARVGREELGLEADHVEFEIVARVLEEMVEARRVPEQRAGRHRHPTTPHDEGGAPARHEVDLRLVVEVGGAAERRVVPPGLRPAASGHGERLPEHRHRATSGYGIRAARARAEGAGSGGRRHSPPVKC
jgi:hypothetical protein